MCTIDACTYSVATRVLHVYVKTFHFEPFYNCVLDETRKGLTSRAKRQRRESLTTTKSLRDATSGSNSWNGGLWRELLQEWYSCQDFETCSVGRGIVVPVFSHTSIGSSNGTLSVDKINCYGSVDVLAPFVYPMPQVIGDSTAILPYYF